MKTNSFEKYLSFFLDIIKGHEITASVEENDVITKTCKLVTSRLIFAF